MKEATLMEKLHVRFNEGEVVSAKPRHLPHLCSLVRGLAAVCIGMGVLPVVADLIETSYPGVTIGWPGVIKVTWFPVEGASSYNVYEQMYYEDDDDWHLAASNVHRQEGTNVKSVYYIYHASSVVPRMGLGIPECKYRFSVVPVDADGEEMQTPQTAKKSAYGWAYQVENQFERTEWINGADELEVGTTAEYTFWRRYDEASQYDIDWTDSYLKAGGWRWEVTNEVEGVCFTFDDNFLTVTGNLSEPVVVSVEMVFYTLLGKRTEPAATKKVKINPPPRPDCGFLWCENFGPDGPITITGVTDRAVSKLTVPGTLSNRRVNIGEKAFMGLENLTSVVIEEGISDLPYEAFANCGALKTVVLPSTMTDIQIWLRYQSGDFGRND